MEIHDLLHASNRGILIISQSLSVITVYPIKVGLFGSPVSTISSIDTAVIVAVRIQTAANLEFVMLLIVVLSVVRRSVRSMCRKQLTANRRFNAVDRHCDICCVVWVNCV
jgi:hypothetical protein